MGVTIFGFVFGLSNLRKASGKQKKKKKRIS